MDVFVTGATGYIGGTVAARLLDAGHTVSGLTRTFVGAQKLRERGITPVVGTLDDFDLLAEQVRRADAVINAANSDHAGAIDAMLGALAGSGKTFIHTSGSSVVADATPAGEWSAAIFDEDTPLTPVSDKVARVALDRRIRDAASDGSRTLVICPCLIYGRGLGVHEESVQIPALIRQGLKNGVVRHVGRGLNVWSTVHVEDIASLYLLALDPAVGAKPGAFFFAENGEASFKDLAVAISHELGLGGATADWPLDEASAEWGRGMATFAMGSNSRVRAKRPREVLGWTPSHSDVFADIPRAIAAERGAAGL